MSTQSCGQRPNSLDRRLSRTSSADKPGTGGIRQDAWPQSLPTAAGQSRQDRRRVERNRRSRSRELCCRRRSSLVPLLQFVSEVSSGAVEQSTLRLGGQFKNRGGLFAGR